MSTALLLAEHDPAVAKMLAAYLARAGFAVRHASTPEPVLAALSDAGTLCAAVLDLTMPGLDPRRLRRALGALPGLPVVYLVAPGPRPRGLAGRGARRWLTRPFGPRTLVCTVAELLRPPEAAESGRLITVGEREVRLTATEYAFLAELRAAQGRPRTRRKLLAAAGSDASDRAADVHIAQLRAKLGAPGLIRTIRGAGFALEIPDPVSGPASPAGTGRLPGRTAEFRGQWPGLSAGGTTIGGATIWRHERTTEPGERARRDP